MKSFHPIVPITQVRSIGALSQMPCEAGCEVTCHAMGEECGLCQDTLNEGQGVNAQTGDFPRLFT
jgi:hypothetical protein